jgi:hypothetical protein
MQVLVAGSQRVPFGHEASDEHDIGHVVFVPLQANGAQVGAPAERASRTVHVPGAEVHVSHGASHGRSQQTPSEVTPPAPAPPGIAQTPDTHASAFAQVLPSFVRQAPAPSQVCSPVQVSGSSANVTLEHVPFVVAHDSHVPLHTRSQHTPSEHAREAH